MQMFKDFHPRRINRHTNKIDIQRSKFTAIPKSEPPRGWIDEPISSTACRKPTNIHSGCDCHLKTQAILMNSASPPR